MSTCTHNTVETEVVIVGSGAGGATVAKELAGYGKNVLIVERGSDADPVQKNLFQRISSKYREGLLIHSIHRRLKALIGIDRTIPVHYRTGTGGTTTIASANAVRSLEEELSALGVEIREELVEIEQELKVSPFPQNRMGKGAQGLWEAAHCLGLAIEPMPKFMDFSQCGNCKKCHDVCPQNVKWSAISYIRKAQETEASLLENVTVNEVITSNGKAVGVKAMCPSGEMHIRANIVVLSAGAIGTPGILQKSGIEHAGQKLFCDPYYFVFGFDRNGSYNNEPHAIINSEFVKKDGFMLTNCVVPRSSRIAGYLPKSLKPKVDPLLPGVMIKIRDDSAGNVSMNGNIHKMMTQNDLDKLKKGLPVAVELLSKAGINHHSIKIEGPGGAHPGGTAAIGEVVDHNLETEIKNLFIADASVLPEAPGLPPMLTIMALSRRLAKRLKTLI